MGYQAANEQMGMEYRDVWPTAMVNDLPDSAFLYIAPGGRKVNGKTDPAHRYFPVRGTDGKPDAAHINQALARIDQANIPQTAKDAARAKAKAMSAAHPDIGSGTTNEYEGAARAVPPELGVQTRTFELELELRDEGNGRTMIGRAVPYGQTADIGGGKTERFVMGAFSRQIASGQLQAVKLHTSHTQRQSGELPIGKTLSLTEQQDGLHGAWELHDTPRGLEALHLMKIGEVTGLSIGFKALPDGTTLGADGAMIRSVAHLDHIALTTSPAYSGAQVMAVRDQSRSIAGLRTPSLQAHRALERVNAPS
jgi:HK97 family phage prohead protease